MVFTVRIAPTRAAKAANLLRTIQYTNPPSCPCHGEKKCLPYSHRPSSALLVKAQRNLQCSHTSSKTSTRSTSNIMNEKEYAFEMASSSIRFGPGVTKEVGMDFKNMGVEKVCVITDNTVKNLDAMKQAVEGLNRETIKFTIFDKCRVEPKDSSIKEAIAFAKDHQQDAFLAVGGGSVIDTAKLMNLYTCYPDADFLDFVNAPLGKGLPITKRLKPLIAVPTTAGTGSETTGTAIFDLETKKVKTGIAHRNLKPTLGICDPINTRTMPSAVHASSGLDVLCHSLESWTAIPYFERTPRPNNPINRPAYQGSNPISDIFSLNALRNTIKYLPRAVKDPEDYEAQSQMLLAATLAGVGFGNAGVHLCHGMSYPISGQNPGYKHPGYVVSSKIIPHGVSVAVTAPAVFRFTGSSNPERHLQAAECFGVDISNVKRESAGAVLAEALAVFLQDLGGQPNGLKGLGFSPEHIDSLVEGTLPQQRVLSLAPGLANEISEAREQLRVLFEDA
ncbi:Dehydroquinate synthase-like protein, partial [Erysiphe pulchra]